MDSQTTPLPIGLFGKQAYNPRTYENAVLRLQNKIETNNTICILEQIKKELASNDEELNITKKAKQICENRGITLTTMAKQQHKKHLKTHSLREYNTWFKKWANTHSNGDFYKTVKPWPGSLTITDLLSNKRFAQAIHQARALMIGVAFDEQNPKKYPDITCQLCPEQPWDTTDHALLQCTNQAIQASLNALRDEIPHKYAHLIPLQSHQTLNNIPGYSSTAQLLQTGYQDDHNEDILNMWHTLAPIIIEAREQRLPDT